MAGEGLAAGAVMTVLGGSGGHLGVVRCLVLAEAVAAMAVAVAAARTAVAPLARHCHSVALCGNRCSVAAIVPAGVVLAAAAAAQAWEALLRPGVAAWVG